jgi:hypothetical protein
MKVAIHIRGKFWLLCILLIFAGFQSQLVLMSRTGQNMDHPPCPALILRLPKYSISGRTPIKLSLDIAGAKDILGEDRAKGLAYNWETSQGSIIAGQGTANGILEVNGARTSGSKDIVVTVSVKGMPSYCQTVLTQTLKIDGECTAPARFDEYGNLSFKDEKSRLDALASSLKSTPDSIAYIVAYAGISACIWEAQWRANRAREYLIECWKLRADRIIIVDGGYRENLTVEVFLSRTSGCGPIPMPTVPADNTQVRGSCEEKYRNTQQ